MASPLVTISIADCITDGPGIIVDTAIKPVGRRVVAVGGLAHAGEGEGGEHASDGGAHDE